MLLDAALPAAAITALGLGYATHRWRFLFAAGLPGAVVIVVDVSTRDLTSGGHDDRGLAAIAESVVLLVLLALFAVGIALRKWRAHQPVSGQRLS